MVDRDEAAGQKLVEETGSNGKLALIDENAGDVCLRVRWPATPWRRVQSRGAMGAAEFFNVARRQVPTVRKRRTEGNAMATRRAARAGIGRADVRWVRAMLMVLQNQHLEVIRPENLTVLRVRMETNACSTRGGFGRPAL